MNTASNLKLAATILLLELSGCMVNTKDSGQDGGAPQNTGGAGTGGASMAAGGTSSGGATHNTGGSTFTAGGGASSGGASSGGASTASAGGATSPTDGGSDGAAGAPEDVCGSAERRSNNTRETGTPFTLGSSIHACLQNFEDNDFYEFTVPDSPSQGGVVAVGITGVDASGSLEVAVETADDDGTLTGTVGYHGDRGQSVWFWLAGAPGTKFRINVHAYVSASNTGYTLGIKYTGAPDANEPNDTRATATPIQVGKPVTGYLFSGFESATVKSPWDDWYKVTLPAGMAQVTLTGLPESLRATVELDDSSGVRVTSGSSAAGGADAKVSSTVTAGDYFLHVTPAETYGLQGGGQQLPAYATTPYSLSVTTN